MQEEPGMMILCSPVPATRCNRFECWIPQLCFLPCMCVFTFAWTSRGTLNKTNIYYSVIFNLLLHAFSNAMQLLMQGVVAMASTWLFMLVLGDRCKILFHVISVLCKWAYFIYIKSICLIFPKVWLSFVPCDVNRKTFDRVYVCRHLSALAWWAPCIPAHHRICSLSMLQFWKSSIWDKMRLLGFLILT